MKKIIILSMFVLGAQISFTQTKATENNKAVTGTKPSTQVKENPSAKKEKLTPEQRAERRTEKLHSELNFTADQKAKVQVIHVQNITKLDEIRQNNSLTEEQKRAEMKAVNKERMKAIDALLTKEQLDILKEKRKNQKLENQVPEQK